MKEFYVTTEYRMTVKAKTEMEARVAAALLLPSDSLRGIAEVEIKGSDIVCITEESTNG